MRYLLVVVFALELIVPQTRRAVRIVKTTRLFHRGEIVYADHVLAHQLVRQGVAVLCLKEC